MPREVMRRKAADNPYLHKDFHGALSAAKNLTGVTSNNDEPWQIGTHGNDSCFWHGLIDEVMLFDRDLTLAEVASIYAVYTD